MSLICQGFMKSNWPFKGHSSGLYIMRKHEFVNFWQKIANFVAKNHYFFVFLAFKGQPCPFMTF